MNGKPDFMKDGVLMEAKGAVALCPFCRRPIRESQRLSYPPQAVGAFATVYRCTGCRRHIGAPIGREE